MPNVSPGDYIRPAIFHKLAEGIDRATLQPGKGLRITKTGGSSVVSQGVIDQTVYHPFKASVIGNKVGKLLTIRLGQVFGASLFNTWRSNNTINWAGVSEYKATGKEGSHLTGSEIMIDIEGTNYISSSQLVPEYPFTVPFKEGVYYLEIAPWSGRQIKGEDLPASIAGNESAFNKYSKNLTGVVRPVIKFAKPTDLETAFKSKMVIPICTVDKYERIFQTLCSDVFLPQVTIRPFTVFLQEKDDSMTAVVTPGTVNRIIPTVNNKYLDQSDAPAISVDNTGYIVIKATHQSGKIFPRKAEVIFVTGDDFDGEGFEDTTSVSYFPIAKINKTEGDPVEGGDEGETGPPSYAVIQLTAAHLVVNRLKAGSNEAAWIWDIL